MTARLGFGIAAFAGLPAAEFAAAARETEARGYHTAWTGEAGGYDAITLMAVVAAHTERLRVGSAVVPVQTRTPVLLGQTAVTLDHIAPGRVCLGIGLSSRAIVGQWHGLSFAPSVQQIREAVQIIRLVASGERVNFEGRFYTVKNFRLSVAPPSRPIRVVLAALGPEMLELAGEIADGVVLNWLSPETVPDCVAQLEKGALKAGRTLADFEIAAFIRTCVTDDQGPARETLARDITGYVTVDSYAAYFRSSGYALEVDAVSAAWRAGDRTGAVKEISPRVLDSLGVVGPEAYCRERIDAFVRAGLTEPVIVPFTAPGSDPARYASLYRTLRTFP